MKFLTEQESEELSNLISSYLAGKNLNLLDALSFHLAEVLNFALQMDLPNEMVIDFFDKAKNQYITWKSEKK